MNLHVLCDGRNAGGAVFSCSTFVIYYVFVFVLLCLGCAQTNIARCSAWTVVLWAWGVEALPDPPAAEGARWDDDICGSIAHAMYACVNFEMEEGRHLQGFPMWHVLAIERCDDMEYSLILRAISVVWNADCSCSPS